MSGTDLVLIWNGTDDEASNESLRDWILSINRLESHPDSIFIVTPTSNSRLEKTLSFEEGETRIPITIVDHHTLFRQYEAVLPTRNPLDIETLIWRIPTLGERYLLCKEENIFMEPNNFRNRFDEEGRAVLRTTKKSIGLSSLLNIFKRKEETADEKDRKEAILNAAALLSKKYYLIPEEGPLPMIRSIQKNFYESRLELLEENISYRELSPEQFCPREMYLLLAEEAGLLTYR